MVTSLSSRLLEALGPDIVHTSREDLTVYAYDGYSESRLPSAAVIPAQPATCASL